MSLAREFMNFTVFDISDPALIQSWRDRRNEEKTYAQLGRENPIRNPIRPKGVPAKDSQPVRQAFVRQTSTQRKSPLIEQKSQSVSLILH